MNFKIKLFLFCIFLTGFLFVIRILLDFYQRKLLNKVALTKIGTLYCVVLFMISRCEFNLPVKMLMTYFPLLMLISVAPAIRSWRAKNFRERFYFFLCEMILSMRVGRPFRSSLSFLTSQNEDPFFKTKMGEIIDVVVFSQQINSQNTDVFAKAVIEEFKKVDEQPHRALERLENLRRKLYIESDFRRRSGQILLQTRLQALILTGLYLAVLVFVLFRYDWRVYLRMISLSTWFFFVGLFWILQAGKKKKWKV